jgi:hypothetical protein
LRTVVRHGGTTVADGGCVTGQLGVRARAILALAALGVIGISALADPPAPVNAAVKAGSSDVAMFQSVVGRVRAGAPYYATMGDELRRGHYPARQVFNWRTPLLLRALAAVPTAVAASALIALSVALVVSTVMIMARQPRAIAATVVFMQSGVLMTIAVPAALAMGEMWAGLLIGLSVCAYLRRRPMTGVIFGLLALFVRELSAPYCVVCTIVAVVNRRWREAAAWLCGASLYSVYYTWHFLQVRAHQLPSDLAQPSSWMEFGGLRFLLSAVQWHAWLLLTPIAASVLALLLVLAGICATKTPIHVRLASAVYVLFFLIAGKSFNQYWGMMAWPTWAFACGYGVDAIRESIRNAFGLVWAPGGASRLVQL